jgi:hypothetical protein
MEVLLELLLRALHELEAHSHSAYCSAIDNESMELINEINTNPTVIRYINKIANDQKRAEKEEREKRHCSICGKLLATVEGKEQHEIDKHGTEKREASK